MKKFSLILITLLICSLSMAQDETYLIFEFMKVDESQGAAYNETEAFWSKIHQQRVKDGHIVGWDLWQLRPGGENQGYQYVTVTLFSDPVKMMNGGGMGSLLDLAKKAYPKMSETDIQKKLNSSSSSRDLEVRLYLQLINTTEGDFDMPVGTVTSMDMMKVEPGKTNEYVTAEDEVFRPWHQQMVDDGAKGSWGLATILIPSGTDVYATHMTFNMFKDWKHYFDSWKWEGGDAPSNDMQMKIDAGIASRDMKFTYFGELINKVR